MATKVPLLRSECARALQIRAEGRTSSRFRGRNARSHNTLEIPSPQTRAPASGNKNAGLYSQGTEKLDALAWLFSEQLEQPDLAVRRRRVLDAVVHGRHSDGHNYLSMG